MKTVALNSREAMAGLASGKSRGYCGRSRHLHALFPLTPALSLRERENRIPRFERSQAPRVLECWTPSLPLPRGEGEGDVRLSGAFGQFRGAQREGDVQRAFSLIEIMVAVTLLSLIVVGLMAVFNHAQRALRMANNQTDVFEGARATVNLIARDLAAVVASGDTNVISLYAANSSPELLLRRPDGALQTNVIQELYMLSRENDTWTAAGYFVEGRGSLSVGTLYRFVTNAPVVQGNFGLPLFYDWFSVFSDPNTVNTTRNASRVTDGIVHLQVRAFDAKGRVYTNWPPLTPWTSSAFSVEYVDALNRNIAVGPNGFLFKRDFLPAFVEVEIGILEPQTTRQFHAIEAAGPTVAKAFLEEQAGKVHLFRQRIPIRNHSQPPAFD